MWLGAISVWVVLIAVICANEHGHEHEGHEEHEHEGHHEHEHEHDDHDHECTVKSLNVVIMKGQESCSKTISIEHMEEKDTRIVCDDVEISCVRGILYLFRKSNQDTQYVMSGCPLSTVTFDKDQDCSTCRTQKPKLD